MSRATSSWQQFGDDNEVDVVVKTSANPQVEINDGSITGLYHFDNTTDSSGYGRNLTNTSGTTFVGGLLSNAASFAGGAFLKASSSAMDISGDFTVGFWIRAQVGLNDTPFIDKIDSGGSSREGFYYGNTCAANQIEFKHNNACHNSAYTISTDTWYWFLVARTGSNVDYYVNNSKVFSFSDSETGNISRDICIGALGLAGGGCSSYNHAYYLDELFFDNTRLPTSTLDALWHGGLGAEVCTTAGCGTTNIISSTLKQYLSDTVTVLNEGSSTMENTVAFGGNMQTATGTVQLEVEVQQAGTSFTDVGNVTSTFVASGTTAIATKQFDMNRPYHWQARAKDSQGLYSPWQQFGSQPLDIDFRVSSLQNAGSMYFDGSSSIVDSFQFIDK